MIVKLVHVRPGEDTPQHVEFFDGVERVEWLGIVEDVEVDRPFSSTQVLGDPAGPWEVAWLHFERTGKLPAYVAWDPDEVAAYLMSDNGDTIDRLSIRYG